MKGAVFVAIIAVVTAFAIFMFQQMSPTQGGTEAENSEPFVPIFSPSDSLANLTESERIAARERGQAIYDRFQCMGCHADEGRALKKLEALGNKYDLESLAAYLKRPNPPMPVFPLSDEDRQQLAIFLIERYPGEELMLEDTGENDKDSDAVAEPTSAPAS